MSLNKETPGQCRVAKKFGISKSSVHNILKRKGIKSYHKVNEQALQDRHNFTYFILMNYMYVFNSLPL